MARLKTAQPNSSLRKIAVVVATAVSGMSVYAQAAVQPKEETNYRNRSACRAGKCLGTGSDHRREAFRHHHQN